MADKTIVFAIGFNISFKIYLANAGIPILYAVTSMFLLLLFYTTMRR